MNSTGDNDRKTIEEQLKERMDSLSDQVDCFDKISQKVFPAIEDNDFTVSGVENISGKRRRVPVLKWAAATAAVVLIVGILPSTAIRNSIRYSLNKEDDKNIFEQIIDEIEYETENDADSAYSFRSYDMTLEEYRCNDLFITPLFACPFESNDDDGTMVRVFIKYCGALPTNQVYAVEYKGSYDEGNIIAAAGSGVRFTDDEISELMEKKGEFTDNSYLAVFSAEQVFPADDHGRLNDGSGNVSAASFDSYCYYKYNDEIIPLTTNVLYYTHSKTGDSPYIFDINNAALPDIPEIPDRAHTWKYTADNSGKKLAPLNDESIFQQKELFLNDVNESKKDTKKKSFVYYVDIPMDMLTFNFSSENIVIGEKVTISVDRSEDVIGCVKLPAELLMMTAAKVYVPKNSTYLTNNDGDHDIILTSDRSPSTAYKVRYQQLSSYDFVQVELPSETTIQGIKNHISSLRNGSDKLDQADIDDYNAAASTDKAIEEITAQIEVIDQILLVSYCSDSEKEEYSKLRQELTTLRIDYEEKRLEIMTKQAEAEMKEAMRNS